MSSKKAFVFDTNFIFKNNNLPAVIKRLGNGYVVYVTQLSIEERFSQVYVEMQQKYEKLNAIQIDYKGIAEVEIAEAFEERYRKRQAHMQKGYDDLFADKIIPFPKDAQTFKAIWDRVHKKLPPFRAIHGSGDKGFKDALLWITMLRFFKANGEREVVFLTDDKGFLDNVAMLEKEFNDLTGKRIEIKNTQYYESLAEGLKEDTETVLDNSMESAKMVNETRPLPTGKELGEIRGKIKNAIGSICRTILYDGLYDYEAKNFILR